MYPCDGSTTTFLYSSMNIESPTSAPLPLEMLGRVSRKLKHHAGTPRPRQAIGARKELPSAEAAADPSN